MIGWDIRSDEDNDDSNDGIVIIMTLIVMIYGWMDGWIVMIVMDGCMDG